MTSGHGEGAVIVLICWATLAAILIGGFFVAVDIAAIVTAAQLGGDSLACVAISSGYVPLNMGSFALSYGIVDLIFTALRFCFWLQSNDRETPPVKKPWVWFEGANVIARVLFFSVGVPTFSAIGSECATAHYSLYVVSMIVVILQIPLSIALPVIASCVLH
jgi:hypothetical protein